MEQIKSHHNKKAVEKKDKQVSGRLKFQVIDTDEPGPRSIATPAITPNIN